MRVIFFDEIMCIINCYYTIDYYWKNNAIN